MFVRNALFAAAVCIPLSSAAAIEPRSPLPPVFSRPGTHWKRAGKVSADQVIHIDVSLTLNEKTSENGAKYLQEISDPASAKFGKHLRPSEAAELFTPPLEHVREVAQWLNSSGVTRSRMRLSLDLAHIGFDATAEEAEALFDAEFHQFASEDGSVHVASDKYSVPERISAYVEFVLPTAEGESAATFVPDSVEVELPDDGDALRTRATGDGVDCFKYMTPHCLRKLYNIDDGEGVTPHPDNTFGFFTPSFSTWISEEMKTFFARFEPRIKNPDPIVMPINGGYRFFDADLINFNLEPHLDYQYGMAIAYPQPVINIQVGDQVQVGNLNTMLAAFDKDYCTALDDEFDPIYPSEGGYNSSDCGTHTPPRVIGIAYAWNEAQFSDTYVKRQCLEFLKLALQGVTVVTGSADRGTADQLNTCIDPETGETGPEVGHFSSVFPASCPWVTAVGATQLRPTGNQTWNEDTPFPGEESLDYQGTTSGGGFSRAFPAPWYQAGQTKAYLKSTPSAQELGEKGYFDGRGRGYPDLSALGLNYLIRTNGALRAVRGTSASVPLVAGMFAKINQARLEAGKGTIGFVNPVLYTLGKKGFRDVTVGANEGCGVDKAFETAAGWDAVTGLGSPDYAKLLDLYMSLP
ncbi:related to serine protease [Cephalotrichum gorgonifer]|uniref:Related to serine protease n=1 Tax=Cephalotrichum gorgonifer TaxID=2041049 RepID=A0AAE8ST18_9PEZI|nr:related to serine protease [Cephalotrichum gorgonifer]